MKYKTASPTLRKDVVIDRASFLFYDGITNKIPFSYLETKTSKLMNLVLFNTFFIGMGASFRLLFSKVFLASKQRITIRLKIEAQTVLFTNKIVNKKVKNNQSSRAGQ